MINQEIVVDKIATSDIITPTATWETFPDGPETDGGQKERSRCTTREYERR
jgi:hypothetical protein